MRGHLSETPGGNDILSLQKECAKLINTGLSEWIEFIRGSTHVSS